MRALHQLALWAAIAGLGALGASCSKDEPESQEQEKSEQAAELPVPTVATAEGSATMADVAERTVDSVVNVSATRVAREFRHPFLQDPMFREFFGDQFRTPPTPQQGLGSGVITSADGIVLTNNHVVEHAEEVHVTLNNKREYEAEIVGTDPQSDLAVLRLKGDVKDLKPLPLGDSEQLRLGDVVLAVGNPYGVEQTVTMGIVSGLSRANLGIVDYEDFIQTDAAINPGNSGGALVNMKGELVGINTAILSRTGGSQGIGFAIPSNMAKPIADSLLEHGRVTRGWLGVTIQDLTGDLARGLGLDVRKGVLVSDVSNGGPADEAGLRTGDVIVSLDGQPTESGAELRNRVAAAGPGDSVSLEIVRGDDRKTLEARLEEIPARIATSADTDRGQQQPVARDGALDGVGVAALTRQARSRFDIPGDVESGVVVTAVSPISPAARAGLRPGDVIVELNRKSIASLSTLRDAYAKARSGETVLLRVRRGEGAAYMAIDNESGETG